MGRSLVLLLLSAVALGVSAHPCLNGLNDCQVGNGFTSKGFSFSHSNQAGSSHSKSHAYASASASGNLPVGIRTASSIAYAGLGAPNSGAINTHHQVGYNNLPNPGTGSLNLQYDANGHAINGAAFGSDQTLQQVGSKQFQGYDGSNTGLASSFNQVGNGEHSIGNQYWWVGKSNPFYQTGSPAIGCGVNGCTSTATLQGTRDNNAAVITVNPTNPFFHTSSGSANGFNFGSAHSGSSSNGLAYNSASKEASINAASNLASSDENKTGSTVPSTNPFLNGAGFNSGSITGHSGSGSNSGSQNSATGYQTIAGGSGVNQDHQTFSGSGNGFHQQASNGQTGHVGHQANVASASANTGGQNESQDQQATYNQQGYLISTGSGNGFVYQATNGQAGHVGQQAIVASASANTGGHKESQDQQATYNQQGYQTSSGSGNGFYQQASNGQAGHVGHQANVASASASTGGQKESQDQQATYNQHGYQTSSDSGNGFYQQASNGQASHVGHQVNVASASAHTGGQKASQDQQATYNQQGYQTSSGSGNGFHQQASNGQAGHVGHQANVASASASTAGQKVSQDQQATYNQQGYQTSSGSGNGFHQQASNGQAGHVGHQANVASASASTGGQKESQDQQATYNQHGYQTSSDSGNGFYQQASNGQASHVGHQVNVASASAHTGGQKASQDQQATYNQQGYQTSSGSGNGFHQQASNGQAGHVGHQANVASASANTGGQKESQDQQATLNQYGYQTSSGFGHSFVFQASDGQAGHVGQHGNVASGSANIGGQQTSHDQKNDFDQQGQTSGSYGNNAFQQASNAQGGLYGQKTQQTSGSSGNGFNQQTSSGQEGHFDHPEIIVAGTPAEDNSQQSSNTQEGLFDQETQQGSGGFGNTFDQHTSSGQQGHFAHPEIIVSGTAANDYSQQSSNAQGGLSSQNTQQTSGGSINSFANQETSQDQDVVGQHTGSGNPFLQKPANDQDIIYGQQETHKFPISPGDGQINQDQSSGSEGTLSFSCNGQGNICVAKHLCSASGYVSKDLAQVKNGPQFCNVHTEVCCTLKISSPSDQSAEGTYNNHGIISTTFGTAHDQVAQEKNGIHGNGNVKQTNSKPCNQDLFGRCNTAEDDKNNGYLPPLGIDSESSKNVPAFSRPPAPEKPTYDEPREPLPSNVRPDIIPPVVEVAPQLGCAAALICVEDELCDMTGVITKVPMTFTSQQLLRRVPLSSCKNPDNGVIGKCCRDPDYVDPWPAGNLPPGYNGGFDQRGFPNFLNYTIPSPSNKQPPKIPTKPSFNPKPIDSNVFPPPPVGSPSFNTPQVVQRPTEAPIRPISPPYVADGTRTPSFPNRPQVPNTVPFVPTPPRAPIPSIPPQVPNTVPFVPTPVKAPIRPIPPQLPNTVPFVPTPVKAPIRPIRPHVPTYPTKTNYIGSPSNQNPVVIATHVPGSQCGVRNIVQRPSGLTDVDVAFGEIPWQAMILLKSEKKLLCSGSIIAPNAILTNANCLFGYPTNDIAIKTGEWKLGYELKHEEPLPFEIINVASVVSHPGYYPGSPANDVAILFLEHDMKLDQHVDMICLPQGGPPQPGRRCISTGWGKDILIRHAAGALMHSIDVDVLSYEQCQQRIRGAESQIPLDATLTCTKAHKQNNNMCQVDPGGPLACDRGDGRYELVGVYNQDTGCLPTNQVATFAHIPTSWIQEMLSHPQPLPAPQAQIPHNHGTEEPCDCQKSALPSAINQYLPPQ